MNIETVQTVKSLEFQAKNMSDNDTIYSVTVDGVRITVLDRETGFGGGIRDIETGLRQDEKFWLASGGFDIRDYPDATIVEAFNLIKANANTCIGA